MASASPGSVAEPRRGRSHLFTVDRRTADMLDLALPLECGWLRCVRHAME